MDVLKPRLAVLARPNGAAFYQFCRDLRIERNGSGQITIMPPHSPEAALLATSCPASPGQFTAGFAASGVSNLYLWGTELPELEGWGNFSISA